MDRIHESIKKIKDFCESLTIEDIFIVLVIILVAVASFGLGRLSKIEEEREGVTIHYPEDLSTQAGLQSAGAASALGSYADADSYGKTEEGLVKESNSEAPAVSSGDQKFVGSKNSDKYHYPWCPGAQRIKEENKVWFATRAEAEAAGYIPAGNCKGL